MTPGRSSPNVMIEYFPLILSCYFLQVPSHALLYQLQQWPRSCFLPTTPLSYRGQRKCSSVNLTAATTTKASLLLPTDLIGGGCESYSTRSCFPPSVWHPTNDTGRRRCTTWWRCSLRKPTRETRWQWGFGWLLWLATSSPGCSSIRGECVCFVGGLVGWFTSSKQFPPMVGRLHFVILPECENVVADKTSSPPLFPWIDFFFLFFEILILFLKHVHIIAKNDTRPRPYERREHGKLSWVHSMEPRHLNKCMQPKHD